MPKFQNVKQPCRVVGRSPGSFPSQNEASQRPATESTRLALLSQNIGAFQRELTLERRETAIENQLQVAKVALRQGQGGEGLSLLEELVVARGIAGKEVLEDAAVGRVGHCEDVICVNNKLRLVLMSVFLLRL